MHSSVNISKIKSTNFALLAKKEIALLVFSYPRLDVLISRWSSRIRLRYNPCEQKARGRKLFQECGIKRFVYGKARGRQAKNSEGANPDTGVMKSAQELISGIAINVSAGSRFERERDGIPCYMNYRDSWENRGIEHLVTEAISTEGPGFDAQRRGKNSFFSSRIKERSSPSGGFLSFRACSVRFTVRSYSSLTFILGELIALGHTHSTTAGTRTIALNDACCQKLLRYLVSIVRA